MIEMIPGILVFLAFFMAMLAFRRKIRSEIRDLQENGVETLATIVKKRMLTRRDAKSKKPRFHYQYTDTSGQVHVGVCNVSWDTYRNYEVGSNIPVVYNPKKPSVSSPKDLMDIRGHILRR